MKLAAIYNVWDGVELLHGSMRSVACGVDLFIIVWQDVSNHGEVFSPLAGLDLFEFPVEFLQFEPEAVEPWQNETNKRNAGLALARKHGCTHFLHMDCDEYYNDFGKVKEEYIGTGSAGSVCQMYTYFKRPTLRFENHDNYFVPFIHEIKPHTIAGGRAYPFRVDPTRRINEEDVVQLKSMMHHFSWVRNDIERKARNSTARKNIMKSSLLNDYHSAHTRAGSYIQDYKQVLVKVPNLFKIEVGLNA